jgi:ABC-2 type transport system permease protein
VASARLGVPAERALAEAEQLVARGHTSRVSHQSPFAYTAPSNLVLFVFMTGMLTSAGLVHSRQLGVTRRMLATPVRPSAVVGGQALAMYLVVLVQAVVLLAVGGVLFGVHWGDPIGVALLVLAVTAGGTASGVLLGTVARTPEQAISIAVPAGIALGMLGGCMWSLEFVGPTMRFIGHLVPQAWAMDGFVRLIFVRRSAAGIAPQLAVLTGYSAALGALAARRLRHSVALSG